MQPKLIRNNISILQIQIKVNRYINVFVSVDDEYKHIHLNYLWILNIQLIIHYIFYLQKSICEDILSIPRSDVLLSKFDFMKISRVTII